MKSAWLQHQEVKNILDDSLVAVGIRENAGAAFRHLPPPRSPDAQCTVSDALSLHFEGWRVGARLRPAYGKIGNNGFGIRAGIAAALGCSAADRELQGCTRQSRRYIRTYDNTCETCNCHRNLTMLFYPELLASRRK